MAGDWIKIERDLPHKPEVMQLAEILNIDELQVVGHLVLFWSWCDANMSLDCPDVIGTKRGLDRASCRDGMVDAMVSVGWLQVFEVDGQERYRIPNFERHLSKSAKTRANEQRKKQRQRSCPVATGTNVPDMNGTQPGPEKRREEKNDYTYIPGSDITIPESLNNPTVIAAIGRWIAHLADQDQRQGTCKAIWPNSPQEDALWRLVASWRATPDQIDASVSQAISGNWQNLRKPEPPRQQFGGGGGKQRPPNRAAMELASIREEQRRREQQQDGAA